MINRKKPIIWIASILTVVLIILIVCITLYRLEANRYGKNSSGRQDEKYVAGMVYGYQYISEKDSAFFSIVPESNKCSFSFSLLSSYFPQGTYAESKDTIIMTSDDGLNTYTFKRKVEIWCLMQVNLPLCLIMHMLPARMQKYACRMEQSLGQLNRRKCI